MSEALPQQAAPDGHPRGVSPAGTARGRSRGPSRFGLHGGRSWSQEIETTAAALLTRTDIIRRRPPPVGTTQAEVDALCAGVRGLLDGALDAARGEHPRYRTARSWWRGTSVEAAFRRLHQAEAELVRLYADHEVAAEIPVAIARTDVALNRDHPLHGCARALPRMPAGPERRAVLSRVVQAGHEAADGAHSRVRSFRNILLTTTACIAVLVTAFALVVAWRPSIVPLCFEPGTTPGMACPTSDGGTARPGSLDVLVVVMLGLLGGALSAAVSIRNLRGTSTPYEVPTALALLKVPAGALTAVGALIAIRGDFVPGLSQLDSQEQILAYALLFGYAQQLLTGFIDRRALGLLDSVPSKDAQQHRPPVADVVPDDVRSLRSDTRPPDTGAPAPRAAVQDVVPHPAPGAPAG